MGSVAAAELHVRPFPRSTVRSMPPPSSMGKVVTGTKEGRGQCSERKGATSAKDTLICSSEEEGRDQVEVGERREAVMAVRPPAAAQPSVTQHLACSGVACFVGGERNMIVGKEIEERERRGDEK